MSDGLEKLVPNDTFSINELPINFTQALQVAIEADLDYKQYCRSIGKPFPARSGYLGTSTEFLLETNALFPDATQGSFDYLLSL